MLCIFIALIINSQIFHQQAHLQNKILLKILLLFFYAKNREYKWRGLIMNSFICTVIMSVLAIALIMFYVEEELEDSSLSTPLSFSHCHGILSA
jgi:hypothetical protein